MRIPTSKKSTTVCYDTFEYWLF